MSGRRRGATVAGSFRGLLGGLLGVKQDPGEALYWYSLAAEQNDSDAGLKADTLERMLAPSTVASVKDRAQAFTAKDGRNDANIVALSDASWQNSAPPAIALAVPYDMPIIGAAADMSAAMTSNPISAAQTLLNGLGYDVGKADGRMGIRTANAIRLFQLQAGMKVTGEVSDELLTKLRAKKG